MLLMLGGVLNCQPSLGNTIEVVFPGHRIGCCAECMLLFDSEDHHIDMHSHIANVGAHSQKGDPNLKFSCHSNISIRLQLTDMFKMLKSACLHKLDEVTLITCRIKRDYIFDTYKVFCFTAEPRALKRITEASL